MGRKINLYQYQVIVKHDKGYQKFTVVSRNIVNAILTITKAELCPVSAVRRVRYINQIV